MFINQRLVALFQEDDEIIKSFDQSLQPYPIGKVNDNRRLFFSELIQILRVSIEGGFTSLL